MSSIVLAVLLTSAYAVAQAPVSVDLEEIGGLKLKPKTKHIVDYAPLALRGSIRGGSALHLERSNIRVAWRALGDNLWRVDPTITHPYKSTGAWKWSLSGVRIGRHDDFDAMFEIIAFYTDPDSVIGAGPIDTQMLIRSASRVSDSMLVRRALRAEAPHEALPEIRIRKIGGQVVQRGSVYNVGSQEIVEIELGQSDAGFKQVIVKPSGSNGERWVMPSGTHGKGNLYYSDAYFGRNGLDQWVDFLVYAARLRRPLAESRISAEQWNSLVATDVIALSPVIRVRRIDLPFDPKTQARLEITRVQNREVSELEEWPVPTLSVIEGRIEGRPLAVGEEISVWGRLNGTNSPWKYWGRAILNNGHAWQLPPIELGPVGQRLAIYATASRGRPSAPAAPNIFVESRRVHLVVSADVAVRLVRIGTSSVKEGAPCSAQRLSSAEVEVSAPSLTGVEKVWMYVREEGASGTWMLLRRATQKEGRIFHMFPTILSQKSSVVWLIAVVAETAADNLDDRELRAVIAFSQPVKVSIE